MFNKILTLSIGLPALYSFAGHVEDSHLGTLR